MKADFLYNIFMLYFHLYKSIIIHKTVIGMLYFPSGLLDIFQAQQISDLMLQISPFLSPSYFLFMLSILFKCHMIH